MHITCMHAWACYNVYFTCCFVGWYAASDGVVYTFLIGPRVLYRQKRHRAWEDSFAHLLSTRCITPVCYKCAINLLENSGEIRPGR